RAGADQSAAQLAARWARTPDAERPGPLLPQRRPFAAGRAAGDPDRRDRGPGCPAADDLRSSDRTAAVGPADRGARGTVAGPEPIRPGGGEINAGGWFGPPRR